MIYTMTLSANSTLKNSLSNELLLGQVLVKIKELTAKKQKTLLVFDLDSTLFDVSPRLQKILIDFAHHPQFTKLFPESIDLLKKAQTQSSDWGIKNALLRAGLENHSPAFHESIKNFWLENFFSNQYVHFDVPVEGAVDFVQAAYQNQSDIVYLSGRDRARMEKGTIEVLKKFFFPLDGAQARLELKPVKGMDDAKFKRDWFLSIPKNSYEQVWFFENEPLNVNLIREHFNHIEIFFFSSTHSGKADPPADIPHINHFLYKEEK